MSKSINRYALLLASMIAIFGFLFSFVNAAHANPSQFPAPVSTAPATTTLAYMSPGNATTTLQLDSYSGGINYATNLATIAIQYTASSTAPTLKFRIEDSPDGVDWYPRSNALVSLATTTVLSGNSAEYQFTFATSTDFGGSGTASRLHQSLTTNVPMRYMRVKFYVPAAGGNGGLWATIIPQKETHE